MIKPSRNIASTKPVYIVERIARSAQLSILLEVSAYPKPGNVHRLGDFIDTKYEHFLVASVVASKHFREAAVRGIEVSLGIRDLNQVGVGEMLRASIHDIMSHHRGGNTSLGTMMLLLPLATASAIALMDKGDLEEHLRGVLVELIRSTTVRDSIELYRAIRLARPGGLGRSEWLDVNDDSSFEEIERKSITMYEILEYSSNYDTIAYELTHGYKITFDLGTPYLNLLLEKGYDINTAVVNTYLRILAEIPDTLITRKFGKTEALRVSKMAKRALEAGGMTREEGRILVEKMDYELSRNGINPGTTADLIASCLMLLLLKNPTSLIVK